MDRVDEIIYSAGLSEVPHMILWVKFSTGEGASLDGGPPAEGELDMAKAADLEGRALLCGRRGLAGANGGSRFGVCVLDAGDRGKRR